MHIMTALPMKTLSFVIIFLMCQAALAAPGTTGRRAHKGSGLNLKSKSVLVLDHQGQVVYEKDADTPMPIASITKLMTAIVILDSGISLDGLVTITKDDRDLVRLTGSRLKYGARLTRRDLLELALMSSENRAAAALGRTFPGGTQAFVKAMNEKALELGMVKARFRDPAGLYAENQASAQELAILVKRAAEYPLIREASRSLKKTVRPYKRLGPLRYGNTNRLLKNKNWKIHISKTGYIDEAGRCLVMLAELEKESLIIVLLNSYGKLTPFGDANRLRKWLASRQLTQTDDRKDEATTLASTL